MELKLNHQTLLETFIPKEFVSFGVQLLDIAPYDVRVLWCFGEFDDDKYAAGPREFMSLIWAPDEITPVGVANHPMLMQNISDQDSFHIWGKNLQKVDVALQTIKANARCITDIPREEIGTSWEQAHAFIYKQRPKPTAKLKTQ